MKVNYEESSDYLSSTSHNYNQNGGSFNDFVDYLVGKPSEKQKPEISINSTTPRQKYESMNDEDLTELVLKYAAERDYDKVLEIILYNYDRLKYEKQDSNGCTILHYFARDFNFIASKGKGKEENYKHGYKNIFKNIKIGLKNFANQIEKFGYVVMTMIPLTRPDVKNFINIQDINGDTPIFIAQKNNNHAYIDCLISAGGDLRICNKQGMKIELATETATESEFKNKFSITKSEDCNRSIDVTQTKGVQKWNKEELKRIFNNSSVEKQSSTIGKTSEPNIPTEEKLRNLARETQDKFKTKYDTLLSNIKSEKSNEIPISKTQQGGISENSLDTSVILKCLIENPQQNVVETKQVKAKQSGQEEQNTADFVDYIVAKVRKDFPQKREFNEPINQPFAQAGGKKNKKIKGSREMFEYKTKKDLYEEDYELFGGSEDDSEDEGMRSLHRVTDQTIRDIETKILENIKKLMKIDDDEIARDYRSGAWYQFRQKMGDAFLDLKKLDKTIQFEKFITLDVLNKVDLKESRKRRLENKEKHEKQRAEKSASSSTPTKSSSTETSTEDKKKTKKTKEPKEKKEKKEKKETKTKSKKEGTGRRTVHMTEYSLNSDLSSLQFSDTSNSYNFSNKNIMPSSTSSFASITSSSRF